MGEPSRGIVVLKTWGSDWRADWERRVERGEDLVNVETASLGGC